MRVTMTLGVLTSFTLCLTGCEAKLDATAEDLAAKNPATAATSGATASPTDVPTPSPTETPVTESVKLNNSDCVDPELTLVGIDVSFTRCDGTLATGLMAAWDLSSLAADRVVSGVTIAGVAGQLTVPATCHEDGEIGCVTNPTFPAVDAAQLSAGNIKKGVTIAAVAGQYPSSDYPESVSALSFESTYCTTPRRANTPFANSGDAGAGDSSANPFMICTLTQLDAMRTALNKHFKLAANIDASSTRTMNAGAGWNPVGETNALSFLGSFDGNSYTIDGLYIFRPVTNFIGLFGTTCRDLGTWTDCGISGNHAEFLRNVRITNAKVSGKSDVGILVGRAYYNNISGVAVSGEVSGLEGTGGIAGQLNESDVANVSASPIMVSAGGETIGGVAGGAHNARIANCYVTGLVMAGRNSGNASSSAGGIIGWSGNGTVDKCFFVGSVHGYGYNVGGILGGSGWGGQTGTVTDSYVVGQINGSWWTGGLIGIAKDYSLSRSYMRGSVSAYSDSRQVGGVIGAKIGVASSTNTFFLGQVRSFANSDNVVGVFTGQTLTSSTNSYYAGSAVDHAGRVLLSQAAMATSKTESYFQGPNSATNNGAGEIYNTWDFTTVWEARSGNLPVLRCPAAFGAVLSCTDWDAAAAK